MSEEKKAGRPTNTQRINKYKAHVEYLMDAIMDMPCTCEPFYDTVCKRCEAIDMVLHDKVKYDD